MSGGEIVGMVVLIGLPLLLLLSGGASSQRHKRWRVEHGFDCAHGVSMLESCDRCGR